MVRPFRKLNAFDLTHTHKLTCNMGYLVPNLCIDVVPGDTMDLTTDIMARMEAMIAPVMHRYDLKYHVFYLTEQAMMPNYYESFITGGKDGDDSTVWPHITSPSGGYLRGSLGDYLGYPCSTLYGDGTGQTNQINGTYDHSAFPNRMYNKIFNHYFINENLQTELPVGDGPGLDTTTTVNLQKANWAKSYFTSALDDTERGDPVYVPIGLSAPVYTGNDQPEPISKTVMRFARADGGNMVAGYTSLQGYVGSSGLKFANLTTSSQNPPSITAADNLYPTNLYADLQQASGATYRDFRLGNRVNYLQELNKRIGYRLVEWTLGHFGVKVPDDKIYEPVYLGGGSQAIMITPIEQTSETTSTSPQGNLAGRGTTALRSRHIRKTFTQHGWVMGIISIMPKQEYSQGLAKRFQRKTRWDYMLPVMDGAGDDKILNSEIYTQGSNVVDTDGVTLIDDKEFGYKPRNEEYRTEPNKVAGELRKGGSMTYWTGGRLFDSLPQLNENFIKANPSYRIFAVESESVPHFTVQCIHHLRMLRPLSLKGTPGLI